MDVDVDVEVRDPIAKIVTIIKCTRTPTSNCYVIRSFRTIFYRNDAVYIATPNACECNGMQIHTLWYDFYLELSFHHLFSIR